MKRPATPIFKVEVKRSNGPRRNWVQVAEDRAAKHSLSNLRQVASGSLAPTNPAPAAPPAEVEPVAQVQSARVLPDLLSVQDLENRTREQFQRKAAERQKPARSPVEKARLPVASTRVMAGSEVQQQVAEKPTLKAGSGGSFSIPELVANEELEVQLSIADPDTQSDHPIASRKSGSVVRTRGAPSDADLRSAKRRGQKVVLKAGERWKRRLPRVCW
jgi:hypothetical protein